MYKTFKRSIYALDKVNLNVRKKEFLAIVGESGAGKSTLALTIIGLFPSSATVSGTVIYKNVNLLDLSKKAWDDYRGTEIGMIFQEPASSLNPTEKVGKQMLEALNIEKKRRYENAGSMVSSAGANEQQDRIKVERKENEKAELQEVYEWLKKVRIPDPESVAERYPFQLSGGMIQRVMIVYGAF